METHSAYKNIIGVELNLPQGNDEKLLKKIFSLFNKLQINDIFIKLYTESFKGFSAFIQSQKSQWNLIYAHTPLLNNIILRDLHKTKQIFQPQLFCRKNYFKQHKSWGYPIFYFTDDEAEIYSYSSETTTIKQTFEYPEDIVAIILLKPGSDGFKTKNIIQTLNRSSGNIELKVKKNAEYKLVVIRKLFLYYNNGLQYKLNIHDEYLLKKQSELAAEMITRDYFSGAYLNGDDFFGHDGFITSGPEITRNYRRISENQFKTDMALYWNKYGNLHEIFNINNVRMINTYIDGILLPKLNYIHKNTFIKSDILNPFFIDNLSVTRTIYKINDEQFIFHKKYYIKTLINIKRILTYKIAHSDPHFAVFFDDLININHSFFEKKMSIDVLLANGVNQVYFKYDAEEDADSFVTDRIMQNTENIKLYNLWIKYVNRLSMYLQKGKPVSKILLLYPGLDYERNTFERTVAELEKSCFDYDILNFNTFIIDSKCRIENDKIVFGDRNYYTIILAGVNKIPLKALRKIYDFVHNGGIAVGIEGLPTEIERQEDNRHLKELIRNIWLEKSSIKATNFKKHENGGIGYFQRDVTQLIPLLKDEQKIINNLQIYSDTENIKIATRDCDSYYLSFITNTGKENQENVVLTCLSQGNIFRVSLEDDLLYPLQIEEFNPKSTTVNLPVETGESILLKIDKQPAESVSGQIHITPTSQEFVNIENKNWSISMNEHEEKVALGDRSNVNPYEWRPVTYIKNINLDSEQLNDTRLFLQLGNLRDWCTLIINDKNAGSKLYPPWQFEITDYVKQGSNCIKIQIGHSISNYLATHYGDEKSIVPVAVYGLFGPVQLRIERKNVD